jgi:hypothetical protein
MALIRDCHYDKKIQGLNLKKLPLMVKIFREESQKEFERIIFEKWISNSNELSLLLKEFSQVDKTEPLIVDTTDPKVMLDLFGYHPYLIDEAELATVFRSHWRQYFEWAKKGMELRKALNPKGRPSTERRDKLIRRLIEGAYTLKDPLDGEDYYIHVISRKDQQIEGQEFKEGQDFYIVPSKFQPETMKKVDEKMGYFPRHIVENRTEETQEYITHEYGISKKTLQNVVSKKDTTILGKRMLFLMPDGRVIK